MDIIDNAGGNCHLTFIVRDDLYSQADVEQFANSYAFLANAFAAQPSSTLGEADVFYDDEMEEALNLGRGPLYQPREPWESAIIHRIDDRAKIHSKRIAVIAGDGSVASYDDIVHNRVDAIAAKLESIGITTGSRVAVLQEPTPDWVSEVGTPWARAVLVNEDTRGQVHKLHSNMKVVSISNNKRRPGYRTPICALPDTVSTILYTSGSSGTPKGIVLTHRRMKAWLEPCGMLYGMRTSGEVILQQSSQRFDMSLMQIFTALCFGGSVCLLPQIFRGDARVISETITLPNYNVYILEEQRRPLPAGLQRGIYIGGAGVAREYLNNPSLTAENSCPIHLPRLMTEPEAGI
ncbi:uncharacterized protein BCR38DRAFT_490904 [Pseudomassariella vexata]|uniref:AMP-dependent synthetase/ligase domain-containing protein n=1 Tax=Pseudomassariella vexata TaxID=1141098 RepID=A0A1Y2D9L4_9PEZI|nr:uncharacterized protein BCR38DRAFT_490904 [Pseudomassariella vexata]ORY55897.1 hypothetical protein BCR38DRAFT_490904 [Pseudomassariella vexata]